MYFFIPDSQVDFAFIKFPLLLLSRQVSKWDYFLQSLKLESEISSQLGGNQKGEFCQNLTAAGLT